MKYRVEEYNLLYWTWDYRGIFATMQTAQSQVERLRHLRQVRGQPKTRYRIRPTAKGFVTA